MARIFIGTSGFHYPHWRGVFYPRALSQEKWLAFYRDHFRTVEINNTFYKLPERATVDGWLEAVPPDFVFAIKASRFITHIKKLKDPESSLRRFIECVEWFGKRAGPLLFQLPPRWLCNLERLSAFLGALPRSHRLVLEFRHEDWYRPEVHDLMKDHHVALCIHDYPGLRCPEWVTAGFVYVRCHGTGEPYSGSYPPYALKELASKAKGWLSRGLDVYVYFNNDPLGHAVANALSLIGLCREKGLPTEGGG